ncbi:MAG: membrane protein insertion efficiency factor YidD [Rhodospirillales bacterium]|nr:membrane protein insertion efficiency factor YidD [Rhodospirillales bacterium]
MGLRTILGKSMQGAIRAYQLLIIPVLPAGGCRFHPTCSHYAFAAIGLHGPITGGWLALKRILRCHPWGEAGIDLVPGMDADTSDTHPKTTATSAG